MGVLSTITLLTALLPLAPQTLPTVHMTDKILGTPNFKKNQGLMGEMGGKALSLLSNKPFNTSHWVCTRRDVSEST